METGQLFARDIHVSELHKREVGDIGNFVLFNIAILDKSILKYDYFSLFNTPVLNAIE